MELYHLVFPLLLLLLSLTTSSADLPSHGCYWTETCQSKWIGGCGSGRIVVDQSDDCHGLCSESKYPPCIPFYTRFHCCKPESPKLTDRCTKCKNKIDFGDEYICCTDCSYPHVIDKSTKLGYCKTRAELALQLKPHEVFTWITGPWMKCSSPCDGGLRYRDVGCFGKIEDRSIAHYPVDDNKCVDAEMDRVSTLHLWVPPYLPGKKYFDKMQKFVTWIGCLFTIWKLKG
ncbi:uncharacterized protein LOC18444687 isoform X2 [Amborella trichopoda]|uniref:uncharacterized protein LOC18444687 isoform X2 n=1 Tax=Amborella trichopoda TaxID=13333 RepID=UPI0009BD7499|nr:uncharacterized protein LOC18444687 isoform X2 [Amborella trichopoda]|eukprot:XP_020529563.1 uncharacterized protein LOC18444687 isoform X2 [Amborella trichopoda]